MCISGPAAAQEDTTTGIARERFKEGVQFFDQKQYEKARAAFVQAYALKRHPAVLLNLAQSELRSGHEAEAAKHFAQFLREAKEATEAERQGADSGLSAAKAVVAEVAVNVDEDAATVSVDGISEGQSPLAGPVYLTPGAHTLSAKKEAREATAQLTAVAGQSTSSNLRFRKAAPAVSPAVEGDKANAAKAEPEKHDAPRGEDHKQPSDAEEPKPSATRRIGFFAWAADSPVAWAGGGLTALGIAGGIGFALGAKNNYDYASGVETQIHNHANADAGALGLPTNDPKNPPWKSICFPASLSVITAKDAGKGADYKKACSQYADHIDNGNSMKTLSIVSWIVAGTAAATTVVVYLVDGKAPVETAKRALPLRASLAPWVSGTERGVFVVGNF